MDYYSFVPSPRTILTYLNGRERPWQGSVLSPILLCIYLDGLLESLSDSKVGCHWGGYFAGAVCYADGIVLLAPSASALRNMLHKR